MQADHDENGVPGTWHLAVLAVMQPVKLHTLIETWGFDGDPSLRLLRKRAALGDARAAALAERTVRWILVLLPAACGIGLLFLFTGAVVPVPLSLNLFPVQPEPPYHTWYSFILFVTIVPTAIALAVSQFMGVGAAIAFSSIYAVNALASGTVLLSMAPHNRGFKESSLMLAYVAGLALGVPLTGLRVGRLRRSHMALLATAILVWVFVAYAFAVSVVVRPWWWRGLSFVLILVASLVRLPFWPIEAALSASIAAIAWLHPAATRRLAAWLPFRLHDLIFLPLPGLRSFLIRLARIDTDLAMALIAEATMSVGQARPAQLALIELQARELEHAAGRRSFALAAAGDLPFLPTAEGVEPTSPIRLFQSAARDLVIGSDPQMSHSHRRRALESAERTITKDVQTSIGADPRPSLLARRLLETARVWRDVIRDEQHKLRRDESVRPEVPTAFIAGSPLKPSDGAELFRGRDALIGLINHDLGPNRRGLVIVFGQRRMGKTSLRNHLPLHLGSDTTIVPINFESLGEDQQRRFPHRKILSAVGAALSSAPKPPASTGWEAGLTWLERIDQNLADRRVIIVIDEVERVQEGIASGWCAIDILDFLRAAASALERIRFVVLTAYPLRRLGPHWLDKLISATTRTVSYLDEASACELLLQPIRDFPDIYPDGGVDRILERTRCHPFLLQKVGDELCAFLNERGGRRRATLAELDNVFERIVRDVDLFDELWLNRTDAEREALRRLAWSSDDVGPEVVVQELRREGYVEQRNGELAVAVPLFAEWIRTNAGGRGHV